MVMIYVIIIIFVTYDLILFSNYLTPQAIYFFCSGGFENVGHKMGPTMKSQRLQTQDYEMLLRLDEMIPKKCSASEEETSEALHPVACSEFMGKECPICLTRYEKTDDVSALPCSHEFHKECICTWLSNYRKTCPLCCTELEKAAHDDAWCLSTCETSCNLFARYCKVQFILSQNLAASFLVLSTTTLAGFVSITSCIGHRGLRREKIEITHEPKSFA